MTCKPTVLLTGSTGAFGRFIASELLKHDIHLVLLVRGESHEHATRRVHDLLSRTHDDKVEVLCSDLANAKLGLTDSAYDDLARRVTHIIHSAGSTRFDLPLEESRLQNVKTTERILAFARECRTLARFGFTGSALIAGRRTGVIKEEDFEHDEGFTNNINKRRTKRTLSFTRRCARCRQSSSDCH